MATDVSHRQLRTDTAALLRRVGAGERLRVTLLGRPVAELVPICGAATFLPRDGLVRALGALLAAPDPLDRVLRDGDDPPVDPYGV